MFIFNLVFNMPVERTPNPVYDETHFLLPGSHIDGKRGIKKSTFKKVISAILAATAAAFGVITCLKGS